MESNIIFGINTNIFSAERREDTELDVATRAQL